MTHVTPRFFPLPRGFAGRLDRHLLQLSAAMGRKLERADILELMLEAFEATQQGEAGAEAFAAFARRDQPPEDRRPAARMN
jgi:hypothetical protein